MVKTIVLSNILSYDRANTSNFVKTDPFCLFETLLIYEYMNKIWLLIFNKKA